MAVNSPSTVDASGRVPVLAQRRLSQLKHPLKPVQIWVLFRRLLVIIAAIVYVNNSIQCVLCSLQLLNGVYDNIPKRDHADYIVPFARPENIDVPIVGKSKLVEQTLEGNLTPRINQTLYLHSTINASFGECSPWGTESSQRIYSDEHLRTLFHEVVRDTSSLIPELKDGQMIVPIVDCSFTGLRSRDKDKTYMRVFYLLQKSNSVLKEDTYLVTFSLSMQDYQYPDLHQLGPAAVLVLSIVSDFTNENTNHYYLLSPGSPFHPASYGLYTRTGVTGDGYMTLQSIPTSSTASEPLKTYQVSSRTGVYHQTEVQQGNIKNSYWDPSSSPAQALSEWEWIGLSVRHDSWAWVHCIHLFFAAETCFDLLVLLIVIYRNKRRGKLWVGDAFVSISKPSIVRVVFILLTWQINGYWTVHKYMLALGDGIGNITTILTFPQMMHADLMMIYVGIVDLLGFIMCERIDPALTILLYEIGFSKRRNITMWFPSLTNAVVAFARDDYAHSIAYIHPKLMAISPLRLSSTHELISVSATTTFCALFPVFATLFFLLAYVPMRKLYRYFYPEQIKTSRSITLSIETEANLTWKSSLTVFEVAIGAVLQSRVGLVSDYDNCIFIKGIKFASADGIYCNGFVVVNNKYLIHTCDIWLILVMILTRIRFRDIYVYELEGYTVQKMARLFYPEMMGLMDLLYLHSTVLA